MQADSDEVFQAICDFLEPHNPNKIEITPETNFALDLEVDSVLAMDMIMSLEDRFEIDVPLNLVSDLHKVQDLVEVVRSQMKNG